MRVGSYIRSRKSRVSARASSRRDARFRGAAGAGFALFVPRASARGRLRFAMASYYQRITVLLNPRAGKQDATLARQVADAFRAADAVCRGSDVVVAGGGDGTVSTAAGALAGTGVPLGVLPLGTLNHFAKDLGIPLDLGDAARVIVAGWTQTVDVGEVNGRLFVNNASVGMYARLIAERAAMQRIGRGKWVAHGLATLRVFRRYQRLRVEVRTATD